MDGCCTVSKKEKQVLSDNAATLFAVALFVSGGSLCQTPAAAEFEVASMRLSVGSASEGRGNRDGLRTGGPRTSDPERLSYLNAPLDKILSDAFDVRRNEIQGPGFVTLERYDVIAKISPGSTQERVREMLQGLLAERLHLVSHIETKLVQGYELRVAPDGPHLGARARDDVDLRDPQADDPIKLDQEGFPVLPQDVRWQLGWTSGHTRARFRETSMQEFANYLGARLGTDWVGGVALGRLSVVPAPVLDETGLTGVFDFTLDYEGFMATVPALLQDNLAAIKKALDRQLGLRIIEAKVPVKSLIIERIEKTPIEN